MTRSIVAGQVEGWLELDKIAEKVMLKVLRALKLRRLKQTVQNKNCRLTRRTGGRARNVKHQVSWCFTFCPPCQCSGFFVYNETQRGQIHDQVLLQEFAHGPAQRSGRLQARRLDLCRSAERARS